MEHSKGIHHITAIAGNPQKNLDFYTRVMGMRLVKKTVNFDDPSVYHLYYGDEFGRPGSVLTFFPWSHLQQGKPGRGQVVAVSFAVPEGAIEVWGNHLDQQDIDVIEPFTRFGKKVLGLQDPNGLHLELVETAGVNDIEGWSGGALPSEHAIRGFHGATLAEDDYRPTGQLLEEHLGYRKTDEFDDRHLFESGTRLGSAIEIIDQSELDGKPGKGTVHHIAFRAKDEAEQQAIRRRLVEEGYHVTEQKDRRYFKSVYFYESGGVLFEVATEGPGFDRDEPVEQLGETLKLPGWLENRRALIEADLPELKV
ncbi:ring-cleaving dioxygenase [Halalkalibaculum sp. DA3122]|uniref:ring-cleaving dioxygenase n=1 Tax=Halalkalibaculum sp. DA3122 TaxID=3373607 RepID=UPI0037548E4E